MYYIILYFKPMTIPSSLTAFYKIKGHLLHNKRMYFATKLSTF
ncbi:unknown [Prevotella sp. CAG:255]|nr:unknown [Prevotella sp. CAG:255]